jgi:hypothetical protein
VAGSAPPEPRLSDRADISCPSLTEFRLDTGEVVLECDNRRGSCEERATLQSTGVVNLRFSFKTGKTHQTERLANSIPALARAVKQGQREGRIRGSTLTTLLSETELPRGYCARPELTLTFTSDLFPSGGTKGITTGELTAIKLPQRIVDP